MTRCIRLGGYCLWCAIYKRCDDIPIPAPPPADVVLGKKKNEPSLFQDSDDDTQHKRLEDES